MLTYLRWGTKTISPDWPACVELFLPGLADVSLFDSLMFFASVDYCQSKNAKNVIMPRVDNCTLGIAHDQGRCLLARNGYTFSYPTH
jgi:hypothetical protein